MPNGRLTLRERAAKALGCEVGRVKIAHPRRKGYEVGEPIAEGRDDWGNWWTQWQGPHGIGATQAEAVADLERKVAARAAERGGAMNNNTKQAEATARPTVAEAVSEALDEALGTFRGIAAARDYAAENGGEYPPNFESDQMFDDWAADMSDAAQEKLRAWVPEITWRVNTHEALVAALEEISAHLEGLANDGFVWCDHPNGEAAKRRFANALRENAKTARAALRAARGEP